MKRENTLFEKGPLQLYSSSISSLGHGQKPSENKGLEDDIVFIRVKTKGF